MNGKVHARDLVLANVSSASILDSMPDGVYITDRERRILFWNKAAEVITGWMSREVVGRCCRDNVLCHVDKDGHPLCGFEHCPLHRSMVTGEQSEGPMLIYARRKDGNRVPVEVMVSPIRDEQNQVIGGIEVFRDMSHVYDSFNRARIIQQETVGIRIPRDARLHVDASYSPRDQVGGDFYRVEALDDHLYALLLADVVGHGLSAALYAMQLRSLWEDGRRYLQEPSIFLHWLSRRVENLTDTEAGYFATAVYATYNAITGRLIVATAGHPLPLLIRQNGDIVQLEASGPGLGLLATPVFTTSECRLEIGDAVLFYSDGAFEIPGLDRDDLGEETLREIIRTINPALGAKALAMIEDRLLEKAKTLSLPDDLTLILLRRNL